MTRRRTYAHFVEDMLNAAEKAQAFVEGMTFEAFEDGERTAYAAVRALEIIGEAARDGYRRVTQAYHGEGCGTPRRAAHPPTHAVLIVSY
jgi:uncharacterized protein with HEPN domain